MQIPVPKALRYAALAVLIPIGSLAGCSDGDNLPASYRGIDVPRARLASPEAQARGRELYLEHCAICHGVEADGRGVRRNLSSRAVDFTDPHWRRKTSPRRVFFVLREGIRGTAMAAWKGLDEEQTWDLVAYVLSVAGPSAE